jgi:hypothetical protein
MCLQRMLWVRVRGQQRSDMQYTREVELGHMRWKALTHQQQLLSHKHSQKCSVSEAELW